MKTYGWIIAIASLWVVISGIIGFSMPFMFWNYFIAGYIIMATGFMLAEGKVFLGMIILLLGSWIVLTSALPAFEYVAVQRWNAVFVGGTSALLGFISLGVEGYLPSYKLG